MPPIEAALEQFRLGARSSRDGGNIENNLAFARGDLAAEVGQALAVRGPEPLRSLSILGLDGAPVIPERLGYEH